MLKYIKGAPRKGPLYKSNGLHKIDAYSNANYASDVGDKKSISSFCTYLGGNIVTWKSMK